MASGEEIERFKSQISLVEYASTEGYDIDRKESSRSSVVMRCAGNNDKIIISRAVSGHSIYFSVRDNADNGTIIDFVQYRRDFNIGQVRQHLRPWVDPVPAKRPRPVIRFAASEIIPVTPDRQKIMRDVVGMGVPDAFPYLEQKRGFVASELQEKRFLGKIRVDTNNHNNIIFPHYDQQGICGYEIKNDGFTGFSEGGTKGLWFSRTFKTDQKLVIAETAIDALSYHALHPDSHTRYCSTAGQTNADQPGLVTAAASKMPDGSTIIIATDADTAGKMLAEKLITHISGAGRGDLVVIRHEPPEEGQDWNDQLRERRGLVATNDQVMDGPNTKRGMKYTI